jgi:hypothetical protein
VGAVPEHGRPVILKTTRKRQPVRESDQVGNSYRTYANNPTVIEPHAHPVHPQTILPAGYELPESLAV